MDITFLPLQETHLEKILEIERLSFPEPWSRGMFEREISLPISHFFIAASAGDITGYGGFWEIADEAHIVSLAVHPAHRSQGIGRKILGFLIDEMNKQGKRTALLEVRKSNVNAQRLYGSFGFVVNGCRPRYYGTEDALLMGKILITSGPGTE